MRAYRTWYPQPDNLIQERSFRMDSTPEQSFVPDAPDSVQETAQLIEAGLPPVTPEPSLARRIFMGPFGLRAGWSLLIYLFIIAAIIGGLNMSHRRATAAHHDAAKSGQSSTAQSDAAKSDSDKGMTVESTIVFEGIAFIVLVLLSWLMAAIEGRSIWAFGLGGSHAVARFLVGAVWGLLALSLLIGALWAMHLLVFDGELDHGLEIVKWGSAQLLAFLIVGLVEEYLFRGYLQFTLTRGLVGLGNLISKQHGRTISFWIAAVVTSALFFLAHTGNSGENAEGLVMVFMAGVLFLVALWRTGSLWWAIGFHTAWDWAQSFLYGVPDSGGLVQGRLFATHALGNPMLSGGTDGPEGSLLCLPILVLVILVLVFFTRSSPQAPLETTAQLQEAGA